MYESKEEVAAQGLIQLRLKRKKFHNTRRCISFVAQQGSKCLVFSFLCVVLSIILLLASMGIIVLLKMNTEFHERALIVRNPKINVYSDLMNSFNLLQDKYTLKKAQCINQHERNILLRNEQKRLEKDVELRELELNAAIRAADEHRNKLEESSRLEREMCVASEGLRLSAEPLTELVRATVQYDYREE